MPLKKLCLRTVSVLTLAIIGVFSSQGATINWTATTGDWSTPAYWGGAEPTSSDTAYINNGGTAYVTQAGEVCKYLYLGSTTGTSGIVQMTDGTLSESTAYIGYSGGIGTFNQSGGLNTTNTLYMAKGTYNLNGMGQLSASIEYIGFTSPSASVTFQQTGGTNVASYITIGTGGVYKFYSGSLQISGGLDNSGTLDFDGGPGVMNATSSIVNLAHAGSFLKNTQAASLTLDANSLLIVPAGFDPSIAFASYNNAGLLHTAGTTLLVPAGRTIFGLATIDDPVDCQGTITASSSNNLINLNNGLMVSGSGVVKLGNGNLKIDDALSGISGGTLSVGNHYIGYSGAGTFTQSGGTNTPSSLYLGYNSGTSGTYELSGNGQLKGFQYIGYSGTGTFNQTGGTNGLAGYYPNQYLGYNAGSNGTYNLNGSGLLLAGHLYVGYYGTGTFNQSGGIYNGLTPGLSLGFYSGSNGTYNLSDTGQLMLGSLSVGFFGKGVFNQSGGTNTTAYLTIGNSSGSSGTYNLTGGTLTLKSMSKGSGTAVFNFGGGTLTASGDFTASLPMALTGIGGDANIDTAGYAVTLSGLLSGVGGLNKLGNNALSLSSANGYSGNTTITAGTLAVNNTTGSGTGSGTVAVNSGGTLSGSGFISGTVSVNDGGTLAPGNSPGILTVNNQVTFQPNSAFSIEVNGLAAGTGYDQLKTTGPVSLAGTLSLFFGSFTPIDNGLLFLINNTGSGTTTGEFQYADDERIGTFNGYDWFITYDANNVAIPSLNGGNDVAIYSVVPEPSSMILLGFAAGSFFFLRRKRPR